MLTRGHSGTTRAGKQVIKAYTSLRCALFTFMVRGAFASAVTLPEPVSSQPQCCSLSAVPGRIQPFAATGDILRRSVLFKVRAVQDRDGCRQRCVRLRQSRCLVARTLVATSGDRSGPYMHVCCKFELASCGIGKRPRPRVCQRPPSCSYVAFAFSRFWLLRRLASPIMTGIQLVHCFLSPAWRCCRPQPSVRALLASTSVSTHLTPREYASITCLCIY